MRSRRPRPRLRHPDLDPEWELLPPLVWQVLLWALVRLQVEETLRARWLLRLRRGIRRLGIAMTMRKRMTGMMIRLATRFVVKRWLVL
ncbi:hypothetical protein BDV93DRAFT_236353 [Ceratobasidium sp. AG-I]|nr:hypothetical protein BDV93DRAFT_236353 [Ceratobasidium sp. AG-I]